MQLLLFDYMLCFVLFILNDIADEMHMLCTCTFLSQHIRIEMYKTVIHKNVNFHQLNDEQNLFTLLVVNGKK